MSASPKQVVMFVIEGGRLSAASVNLFKEFGRVYQLHPRSLLVVFNRKAKLAPANYEATTVDLFRQQTSWPAADPFNYVFLPDITASVDTTAHDFWLQPAAASLRNSLLTALARCTPLAHETHAAIEARLASQRAQAAKLQRQLEKQKQQQLKEQRQAEERQRQINAQIAAERERAAEAERRTRNIRDDDDGNGCVIL
eukprot:TRINITY_DN5107_c0_g1_i3.p1 TRINITY_DN5107_c0_g1~~TRINITY_DN5107_c0_g1_i3.p1  ORF type:complete len:198 (+),score=47.71 TRINITY_DN5107_c0_g1_i3:202-795(+)